MPVSPLFLPAKKYINSRFNKLISRRVSKLSSRVYFTKRLIFVLIFSGFGLTSAHASCNSGPLLFIYTAELDYPRNSIQKKVCGELGGSYVITP